VSFSVFSLGGAADSKFEPALGVIGMGTFPFMGFASDAFSSLVPQSKI
jgi:hypothetical protein